MSQIPTPGSGSPRVRGLARSLPPDLAAAYEAACGHALVGFTIFAVSKMATQGRPLGPDFATGLIPKVLGYYFTEVRPTRQHLEAVEFDLIRASDPDARFGHTSAHEAAIHFAEDVVGELWGETDLLDRVRSYSNAEAQFPLEKFCARVMEVCRVVATSDWPDGMELINAVSIEATRAGVARGGGQPRVPTDSPAATTRAGRGKNIDARMQKVVTENLESWEWSSVQWGAHLGCDAGMVRSTRTWKKLLPGLRAGGLMSRIEMKELAKKANKSEG